MRRKNKFAWREERKEEISCDYQNRLGDREHELAQKIEKIKKLGIENLKRKIENKRRSEFAAYKKRVEKLSGQRALLRQQIEELSKSLSAVELELSQAESKARESLLETLKGMNQAGIESLRNRISTIRRKHSETIERMRTHYEAQIQKLQ